MTTPHEDDDLTGSLFVLCLWGCFWWVWVLVGLAVVWEWLKGSKQ